MPRIDFEVTIGAFGLYPTVEAKGSAEYPSEFRDFMLHLYGPLHDAIKNTTENEKRPSVEKDREATCVCGRYSVCVD